jgi:DNA excision repair protein ERCC-4
VGDYVIDQSIVVERKSVPDLHRSVMNGRLWRQVGAMRSVYAVRYLLIEGGALNAGRLSGGGVRGALLAAVESNVRLLWSKSPRDSAHWLHAIANRSKRSGPRPRRASVRAPVAFLTLVPGVSPSIADELVRRFGSVGAVANASEHELLAVPGLGPVRVAALKSILA